MFIRFDKNSNNRTITNARSPFILPAGAIRSTLTKKACLKPFIVILRDEAQVFKGKLGLKKGVLTR